MLLFRRQTAEFNFVMCFSEHRIQVSRTSFEEHYYFSNEQLSNSLLYVSKMTFNGKKINGVLCDITGVLTESVSEGGSKPIEGSVEALNRLKMAGKFKL